MLVVALVVLAAVAMLIFILRVNRRDRQEIEALVDENGRQEEILLAKMEQARGDYDQALAGGDQDLALKLGTAYYASKTEYEYWSAPPIPFPDDPRMAPEERRRIEGEIERDNSALRHQLQARNEQLLEHDLRTMIP